MLHTLSEYESFLGVSRQTLKNRLDKLQIEPTKKTGSSGHYYDVQYVISALSQIQANQESDSDPDFDLSKASPQDRKAHYQAEQERLNLEERQRKIISVDKFEHEVNQCFKNFNLLFVRMLVALEQQGIDREHIDIIETEINRFRAKEASQILDEIWSN